MNLVYLADTHIPSRATNGMQIMQMCAAFAACGVDVTLVHPHRFGNRPEGFDGDVHAFYGVPDTFRRVTLPTPLTLRLTGFRRYARVARAVPFAGWLAARSRPRADPFVVYSRSFTGSWLALEARRLWGNRSACRSVVIELHGLPGAKRAWDVIERAHAVVAISTSLADRVRARACLKRPILVEHDGVDLTQFVVTSEDRLRVRSELAIDDDVTLVGYAGRVNAGKGAITLLDAATRLDDQSVRFLLVGKVYEGLEAIAATRPNVILRGFVPPPDVPAYLAASDILVLPTSVTLPYSDFTSPLKLFEYMASGRPIVCSDLPVLHEVVQPRKTALMFPPDDPDGLAMTIQELCNNRPLASHIADEARRAVTRHTWDARAERILEYIRGSFV
jgi:glycosyltransferase involved in cell wall biosynthesis